MKKVRGGGSSSAEGTSAAMGSRDTPLLPEFFLFLARSNMFFCTFEVNFTIIIGLRHV